MDNLTIIYISLSGNTTDFVERLSNYCKMERGINVTSINIKEYKGEYLIREPFVSILPSYLEGGNGIHNGYQEILTTKLGDFIAANDNAQYCYGIIGSGNRNFNKQFCLTAYQYAERFQFPVIDEFELRGSDDDIIRIADSIITQRNAFIDKQEAE
ncbi:class Ib ribonucleoside-diphosphate reductase assembly flavoprotein NrdI [Enterococcus sp. UD-01]|jgi:protein involved in ribonucleotide reduction|uniref:class Ib ribonucleoside-diphosphate reductase assembly flavoprotein NrdI n=1 Tax=Enterococcus sp. UD-01 TaxID=3373911 RepID=UPI0038379549